MTERQREGSEATESRRAAAARNAAILLRDGRAATLTEALRMAAERSGVDAGAISPGLVRDHARALALVALGDEGYRHQVADVLEHAEMAMTLLETLVGGAETALIGRAAKGQVDADPCCRIRARTDDDVGSLAAMFVAAGYDEPRFTSIESRWGRLGQLVIDDDGVALRITRCPPALRIPFAEDLRQDRPVPSLTLAAVRRLMEGLRGEIAP